MLPLTCKGLAGTNSLLLIYINALWLYVYMLAAMPLRCINTLWLGVYYMLEILGVSLSLSTVVLNSRDW